MLYLTCTVHYEVHTKGYFAQSRNGFGADPSEQTVLFAKM